MSPLLIILVIAGYFVLLFAISYFTGRDAGNQAFFIGNKESPWYVVAFGMIGVSLSGVTFISVPGVVGNFDSINGHFAYMQLAMGYLPGYFIVAFVLMPLYYRLNLTSIYGYLEERFGKMSYKTGASYFLLARTIGASFRLFLVALIFQKFIFDAWGIPFAVNVLFTLILIWIYTLRGGIKTIVWTDTLQTVFMLLAAFFSFVYVAKEMSTGLGGLLSMVADSEYSRVFFMDDYKSGGYFWKHFFGGMFMAIGMTGLDQDLMQKNNSCKNIGDAQKNMISFSLVYFLVNLLFVSLGALLYLYASTKGLDLQLETTDHLFPTLAFGHFPTIIGLLFLVGLVAATYSSADSALTALTTSFCIDFLDFEKKQNRVAAANLQRTRYGVHIGFTLLLFAVIMLFWAVIKRDVVTQLFIISTYTYGPLIGLYAFGLFTKRQLRDALVPVICIAAPVVCFLLKTDSATWSNSYQFGFEMIILNALLTFVGLFLISLPPKK